MKTYTILAVDDESIQLEIISGIVEAFHEPYRIMATINPQRAYQIAVDEQPDVIITDWDMPGMNGIELIQLLKSNPAVRDIPVLMCTGTMTDSHNLYVALKSGAEDYVRKPVDGIELMARIHAMLTMSEYLKTIKAQKQELEKLNGELAAKNEILYRQAVTDKLTGIYNRTYMMEALARDFSNALRYQKQLACILLDIDQFKSFNDTYGHQIGDFVLKETAAQIAATIRQGDTVCRYGGEEFLVILPETGLADAVLVAEKIRATVEKAVYVQKDLTLKVTVSLGVTDNQLGNPGSEDKMLGYADEALYTAKKQGRNRVVQYSA